ncbi:DUF4300 family protein [Aedoeadaptatus pacaensis]|uniref:DUF4300 family protein n=1 Tax=Aedoeadaptatus pacaensis TaxID=1776390 RepID=UPI0009ED860B|nr:DUF4300 family protein [Peptoniphilus pacaensis]
MKIKHILILFAALGIAVISCGAAPRKNAGRTPRAKARATVTYRHRGARRKAKRRLKKRPCRRRIKKAARKQPREAKGPSFSNMAKAEDKKYVEARLKSSLSAENVDRLMALVDDYNGTAAPYLTADFSKSGIPTYDVGKITEAQSKKPMNYPNTNCRITTYLLLKDDMKVSEDIEEDGELLFMDKEALSRGGILNEKETADFIRLFSRVKTDGSKDPAHQGKIMEKFLSQMTFSDKASMVSVVLHDNLDGNYLFIGHVGVLVKDGSGYLFVEKISFEEPYQAIRFQNKEACYGYLKNKYKDYTDPNVAPPFIMENNRYVG